MDEMHNSWPDPFSSATTVYKIFPNSVCQKIDETTYDMNTGPFNGGSLATYKVTAIDLTTGCMSDAATASTAIPICGASCPTTVGQISVMVNMPGAAGDGSDVEIQLVWSGSIGSTTEIYRRNGGCASSMPLLTTVSGNVTTYYDTIPSGAKVGYKIISKAVCGGQTMTVGESECIEVSADAQQGAGAGTVYYYITDHLGTVRAVLDQNGIIKSPHDYEPYGVGLQPQGDDTTNFNYKFTGQERDTRTNLDYMHARFYASSMGRFLKPDNIIGNMANPQSWNLYSYVNGNPVNFNDPTGHGMNRGASAAYMQGSHSFGMSWFDQFSWHVNPSTGEPWSPWAGQTAENSWYFGATVDALSNWISNSINSSGGPSVTIEEPLSGPAANPLNFIGPPNPFQEVNIYYFDLSDFTSQSIDNLIAGLFAKGYTENDINVQRVYGPRSLDNAIDAEGYASVNILVSHHGVGWFEDRSNKGGYAHYSDAQIVLRLRESIAEFNVFYGCYTLSAASAMSEYTRAYGTLTPAWPNLNDMRMRAIVLGGN